MEEVVDMAWPKYLVPLIEMRYPGLTPAQLAECHAYAYGGSVIQDMGYHPFGSKEFSNLLHYVRSGSFVDALLSDSTTSAGALAHYYGDTIGHQTVNVITGEEYPHLRSRFGRFVTYDDNTTAHLRNEFGFDVVEAAHGAYSQDRRQIRAWRSGSSSTVCGAPNLRSNMDANICGRALGIG
jgi:hypothetical protein